jgi:hypothetical protein
VLSDHVDPAAARLDAWVEDDALARLEPVDTLADRVDDAGAVRAEDPRFRNGGQALADPDIKVVERRSAEADEDLAGTSDGIGSLLEHEDLRAAIFVDPNRAHRGTLSV